MNLPKLAATFLTHGLTLAIVSVAFAVIPRDSSQPVGRLEILVISAALLAVRDVVRGTLSFGLERIYWGAWLRSEIAALLAAVESSDGHIDVPGWLLLAKRGLAESERQALPSGVGPALAGLRSAVERLPRAATQTLRSTDLQETVREELRTCAQSVLKEL